ncbi:MAG: hypothetical protein PVG71_16470, partial [Anaerolineae bacterium]
MKRLQASTVVLVFALGVLVAIGAQAMSDAPLAQGQSAAATITVTSAADSGPGTLRQALLDAANGDTITFDQNVFPPASPVTISLTSDLPD